MASVQNIALFTKLIPRNIKLEHINELLKDLKTKSSTVPDLIEKCQIVISFISDKHSLLDVDDCLYVQLVEASLNYTSSNQVNDLQIFKLLSTLVSFAVININNSTCIKDCFQKYLPRLICPNNGLTDEEILNKINILDIIVTALLNNESCFIEIYNEIISVTVKIFEQCLKFSFYFLGKILLILKKIHNYKSNDNLFETIWTLVKKNGENQNRNNEFHGVSLFILCFLADHYITIKISAKSYPLFEDVVFWELIHAGLINDVSLIRKQSLYLLKRYVCVFENCCDCNFKTCIFCWDDNFKNEILQFWNVYFILWETIEEKQVHLILPALKKLDYIIELSSKQIFLKNWMYNLFIFCFKSESISVIKYSIISFFNTDVSLFVTYENYEIVLLYLFRALNNMMLFSGISHSSENELNEKLITWFQLVASQSNDSNLFNSIISVTTSVSLSSVPMYFVMNALTKASWNLIWGKQSFELFKTLIVNTLRGQNIKIRGAIQNLIIICITNNLCQPNINLIILADFLIAFPKNESLKRGTNCWRICSEWIPKFITKKDVDQFIQYNYKMFYNFIKGDAYSEAIPVNALSRMLVLLEDSSLLTDIKMIELFNLIFEPFDKCDKRMYISPNLQNLCFTFIYKLLNESIPYKQDVKVCGKMVELIKSQLNNLILFLCLKLKTTTSLDELENVDIYLKFINIILSQQKLLNLQTNFVLLHEIALTILHQEQPIAIQEYFALKFEYLQFKHIIHNEEAELNFSKLISKEFFLKIFYDKLLNRTLIREEILYGSININRTGGKLISQNIQAVWSILYCYMLLKENLEYVINEFPLDVLFKEGLEVLNTGGKESIICILRTFGLLLSNYKNKDMVIHFFDSTWEACFEHRKTELFWKSYESWINTVFQVETVNDADYQPILLNYCKKIITLGNDIFGMANLLIQRFNDLKYVADLSQFAEILVSLLLFGPLLNKDKRIEKEVCDYIISNGKNMAINILMPELNNRSNIEVRILSLNVILDNKTKEHDKLVKRVILELLCSYKEPSKHTRYFNDSLIHRKRNRMLQALLILQSLIKDKNFFKGIYEELLNFVTNDLLRESHQPSIRYQLEWLYILLITNIKDEENLMSHVWECLSKASNERLGSVCSFISIAYHLIKLKKKSYYFEQFIENVLPWSMSQNFNIRLYAQVTLKKLWPLFNDVSQKYAILTKNQWKIYQQGNMLLNANKLETDFYFDGFDPVQHYSIETIFWDLPRLSNISQEEWISLSYIKSKLSCKPHCINWNDAINCASLKNYTTPTWIMKSEEGDTEFEERNSIQKKFIPWKSMFPQEIEPELYNKKNGELILVASLIDKTSNLGGLARTCDIFGAKELILDSANFINDKQFTSLSMTAEKHINIREVKSYHLTDYISNMKEQGYTVIGAEQTTGSVSLSDYKFKKKTLLILGNEREGIPVNVLPFLDKCIEIPQYGLIRSLNVHVTGAIFLWEYAKQYMQENSE